MFTPCTGHIPSPSTPFFGRYRERSDLAARLADPACRLITLTGAGGIGKTRLALQVATDVCASFAHGVWFVSLEPLRSATFLASAVADVFGYALSATSDPRLRLRTLLADKNALLILDNFEHLLRSGGAEFLLELLATAPRLKLLLTSRAALELQAEWRYPVGGMPVPPTAHQGDVERYDLVQLFVDRARRVRNDFSLADEQAGVVELCQLLTGVPLAVELAASWTDVLRCDTIAAELRHDVQALHTTMRDVPVRHQSLRAVFDHSWKLLNPAERTAFQRLAVFRGGFARHAAAQIAGATLPILATLARHSLLHLAPDGRYQMHELVRQYARQQLTHASSHALADTRDRHSAYYTTFLHVRNTAMNGGPQIQATAEIAAELDNVRAAWSWAITRRDVAALVGAANALFLFCQYRSRYLEGIQLFEGAVDCLDDEAVAAQSGAALLLYELAWLYVRVGRLEDAERTFTRCHAVYQHGSEASRAAHASDPQLGLGLLASLRGDYARAQQLLEQVRQLSEREGQLGNQQTADYFLAGVHRAQGQYQVAYARAQAAYNVAHASRDRWFMAFCLHELGQAACALGEYEQARHQYQESLALREPFGDTGGMAVALIHLGAIALLQGHHEDAEGYYRRGLALYRDINDLGGVVAALEGLGRTCALRGRTHAAAEHVRDALRIAVDAHLVPLQLALLVNAGQLLLQTGRWDRGLDVLLVVQQHAATGDEARERVQQLLRPYRTRLLRRAARGQDNDLDRLTARIQADLAAVAVQEDVPVPASRPSAAAASPLVEPLTAREREILALLATGHSYQDIAAALTIAVGSVKSHAHNIYAKLGVRNRMQAVARAGELGVL